MDMITLLAYAIRITVGTLLIYLSIQIVDRGNYRNTLVSAFATAFILSLAGSMPFLFLFGLLAWIYILINWYSIGFFKSFLCVIVYAVLSFFLNVFLITALISGGFVYARMTESDMYARQWDKLSGTFRTVLMRLPESLRKRLGIDGQPEKKTELPFYKQVLIVLKNGRSFKARILMEGKKGYLVDIADGKSEVVIRKDMIDYIKK